MKMNRGTSTLLALVSLASVSTVSAKTIVTIHGSVTNTLDPSAVIEIRMHLTGPSIHFLDIAPFDGHGFITPADPDGMAPLALETCRFALSGEWVHEDRSFYLGGTVHGSSNPQLVGARFGIGASAFGFLNLFFDTDPDDPHVGGPFEYYGVGSIEIHETK
jgi:hypothetical protein